MLVIQKVSADMKLGPEEMQMVIRAHQRRNGTSYHSPFPPISHAEAMALVHILEKYIPVAYRTLGVQSPAPKP